MKGRSNDRNVFNNYDMTYQYQYPTPEGFDNLFMRSDGVALTGLWFDNTHASLRHSFSGKEEYLPVFRHTCRWLDTYFSGHQPEFTPLYRINNSTPFRRDVLELLCSIPYGQVLTYGQIATAVAQRRGFPKVSARAVGGAVGWNPIAIIIPCHRVVGVDNKLTGYNGGIQNKSALLSLEQQGNHE